MSYLNYFNLIENIFTNQFYYKTKEQKEAISRLEILLETGGIMHIYVDYGVGKIILLKKILKQLLSVLTKTEHIKWINTF